MSQKTRIPQAFTVTDSHREWASKKHGAMHLPDVFLSTFKDHFEAKGTQWEDWDRAFQNWINRSSPSGQMYNSEYWARQLYAARALEPQIARSNKPPATVAGRYVDSIGHPIPEPPLPGVNASDAARSALNAARRMIR